jgi:hypothetical protein
MKTSTIASSTIALAALVLAITAAPIANAQSAPAPAFKVGDRWVYDVKSGIGLTATTYQETREVTAVGTGGFLPNRRFRRAGRASIRNSVS